MDSKNKNKADLGARSARPWGQALLRAKAQELLRDGSLAPSVVMGNLLAAAAAPTVDVSLLAALPRPMSVEANRVIADALRRSRLPNADVAAILDELVALTWTRKASPAPIDGHARLTTKSFAGKPQQKIAKNSTQTPHKASVKKPMVSASPPKAPIIVRRSPKLSNPSV